MFAIALLTWREVARRRLLAAAVLLSIIFLGLYGLGLYYANKEIATHTGQLASLEREIFIQQILSMGLYFGSFIVSFLAIFAAAGTISGEIEGGTIYALIARPIHRSEIIFGKLFGYSSLLVVYAAGFLFLISSLVYLVTGFRINGIIIALGLFCLQPLILLSVTTLGSVSLPSLANGIVMFMLYAIAVVGGMVEQIGWLARSVTMQKVGVISSLVLPIDAVYRKIVHILLSSTGSSMAFAQMGPFGCMSEPSVWMLFYTLIYIAVAIILAVYFFCKKDIT